MKEIDFFGSSKPRSAEERERKIADFVPDPIKRGDFIAYGYNYYDNSDYGVGYGGYYYDGRYEKCVDEMIAFYKLAPNSKVLEIGCAKGFILCEFLKRGMDVSGVDLSAYAVENAVPEVKPYIVQGSCVKLPWDSGTFDLVYCKETLPHLTEEQLDAAISEALRVCKTNNVRFEIQCSDSARGQQLIKAWDETHQSIKSADWWRELLHKHGFKGQVNFKTLF